MKRTFTLLLCLCALNLCGQEVSIMSFNIRYDNPNDGEDQWAERKEALSGLIKYYEPAAMGVQEAVFDQMQYLDSTLRQYSYIGVGRDDGVKGGEFSAIFYDSTRLALLDEGTFWLSTTPDEVSKGWDAALPRICTYGLFRDRSSEKIFWVFNTHFDHIGEAARINSAALLVRRINEMNIGQNPVLLLGDLNSEPDDAPIQLLNNNLKDAYLNSTKVYGPEGTFFGFDPMALADRRIDYVFGKGLQFQSYRVIDDRRPNNRHISDHLPVLVNITLK